jgi:hypothetical protein
LMIPYSIESENDGTTKIKLSNTINNCLII